MLFGQKIPGVKIHIQKDFFPATRQRPIRICRTHDPVSDETKSKLADLCDVHLEAEWSSVTVADISQLPLHFYRQGMTRCFDDDFVSAWAHSERA